MGLKLQTVTPRQGWTWLRDGLRLYFRRPLGFTGLFLVSMIGVMLLLTIPFVGGVLGLAMLPMLTLGFMAATRAALRGEPMGPQMFVTPLRPGSPGQTALVRLCVGYGLASVATVLYSGMPVPIGIVLPMPVIAVRSIIMVVVMFVLPLPAAQRRLRRCRTPARCRPGRGRAVQNCANP